MIGARQQTLGLRGDAHSRLGSRGALRRTHPPSGTAPVRLVKAAGMALRTLVALAVLALAPPQPLCAKEEIQISEARTRLVEGTYVLDAQIDYRLSPIALEALGNGVPLTFVVHIQVRRTDAWIWTESVTDLQLRYRLRYKPLSERYEVFRLPGDRGRSFVSREAAIAALGELRDLSLLSADRLDPGEEYEVQIKVELDVEELPLPLRPVAYLRPAWKLSSSWTKWPLTP